jgi:hypothetical protein
MRHFIIILITSLFFLSCKENAPVSINTPNVDALNLYTLIPIDSSNITDEILIVDSASLRYSILPKLMLARAKDTNESYLLRIYNSYDVEIYRSMNLSYYNNNQNLVIFLQFRYYTGGNFICKAYRIADGDSVLIAEKNLFLYF